MAKKKKLSQPTLVELVSLAEKVNLIDGFFNGDVEDECRGMAQEAANAINREGLEAQLARLLEGGYSAQRLAELINEGSINS